MGRRRRKKSDAALGWVIAVLLAIWGGKAAWDASPLLTVAGGVVAFALIAWAATASRRRRRGGAKKRTAAAPARKLPRDATPAEAPVGTTPAAAVVLDPRLVARRQREADEVGAMLAQVFAESEAPAPAQPLRESSVAGLSLDARHAGLLAELLARPTWARADYEDAARRHGLMPDGAMELINDAAFAAWDAPALEGDDPIEVATDRLNGATR